MVDKAEYPATTAGYELEAVIGHGAFATVHAARVLEGPLENEAVAVKQLNLEEFADSSMEDLRRELQTMRLCTHPAVATYHVAFAVRTQIWLVMPLLEGGSCTNLMQHAATSGLDEQTVAYILGEAGSGLQYLHENKQVHRDVKAGNILLSGSGQVYISDFGVAASLREQHRRTTFVGTPCWMAPEVLEQIGYDYKADIWSFGITAIELLRNEAPYQRLPALKVLKLILEEEPPRLDRMYYGALVADLTEACLQKDPMSRSTMQQLLTDHATFFKQASPDALRELLRDLPPLKSRVQGRRKGPPEGQASGMSGISELDEWDFSEGPGSGIGDQLGSSLSALPETETSA
jgi:serine/threonine-protein kinase OSR1/STK39